MRRLLELIRHVRAGGRRLEDELRDEIDLPVSNLRTHVSCRRCSSTSAGGRMALMAASTVMLTVALSRR